jgi:hypothetical protein
VSLGRINVSPYNLAATITAAPGAYALVARATASDGVTIFESAPGTLNVAAPVGVGPNWW